MSATLVVLLLLLVGGLAALLVPWPPSEAALVWLRWSAGLRRFALRVNGRKWVYLAGGKDDPVVMIHGFGGSKDNFTALAGEFTEQHRVVIPDLPGFGESDVPGGHFHLSQQARSIAEFLAALRLPPVHVVGNSMGGYLAVELAALAPDLVRSLWLIAPAGAAGAAPSPFLQSVERGDNWLITRDLGSHRQLFDQLFGDRLKLPSFVVDGFGRRAVAHADLWERAFQEAFADMEPLESRVQSVRCPILISWGDQDNILDPSGLEALSRVVPAARLHSVEGAGHLPMAERPEECAAEWRSWQQSRR